MFLVSMISPGQAAEQATVRHVGIFHDLSYAGDFCVSYAGGAILQFAGTGFNADPVANRVQFRTTSLSTQEVTLLGTLMNGKEVSTYLITLAIC